MIPSHRQLETDTDTVRSFDRSPPRRCSIQHLAVLMAIACVGIPYVFASALPAQENAMATDPLGLHDSSSSSNASSSDRIDDASDSHLSSDELSGGSAVDGDLPDGDANSDDSNASRSGGEPTKRQLNLLTLLFQGGWLMLPLAIMAVLLVMLVIERLFALRRGRIIPPDLVEELGDLGAVPGVLDPRRAYRLCQEYPSPAATAIRTMLLKIGRPQTEIEHAVAETNEREADRLYASVRWLNLMTAVAPLIGLLGTVWGMIWAFYETTQMAPGTNKAEHLAEGIYIALVTTLGGLTVAIPAAICSHYFEARIIRLFHEIDELLFSLLPQVERFEGRLRTTPHSLGGPDESSEKASEKRTGPTEPPDGTRRDPAHVR